MFVQSQNSNLLKIKDSEHLPPDNLYVKIYKNLSLLGKGLYSSISSSKVLSNNIVVLILLGAAFIIHPSFIARNSALQYAFL